MRNGSKYHDNQGKTNRKLHTLALRQRDPCLVALARHKHVSDPGGELAVEDVADTDNVEAAEVALTVNDDTRASHVASAGGHDKVPGLELDVVDDLVLVEVELDRVVDLRCANRGSVPRMSRMGSRAAHLDGRVRVTDGASVVGDNEGDTLGTELHLLDLEELVGGLLGGDAVDGEATLDVVKKAEVLAGLLNRDDVCVGSSSA